MYDKYCKLKAYLLATCGLFLGCSSPTPPEPVDDDIRWPAFETSLISNQAALWWARSFVDVDGDGILDVALQNDNGAAGWLGYLKGDTTGDPWQAVIIAETSPNGGEFAAGDLLVCAAGEDLEFAGSGLEAWQLSVTS